MNNFNDSQKKTIPGPSLLQYFFQSTENLCMMHLNLAEKYGKICRIPGLMGYYLLSHPDYIEYVLKTNCENYIKTDLGYKGIKKFLGEGLLTIPTMDEWLPERRLLQPLFQPHHLDQFTVTIINTTLKFCEQLKTYAKQNTTFNLADAMLELLFIVTSDTLFSGDFIQYRKEFLRFSYLGNWYTCRGLYLFPWLPTLLSLRYYYSRKQAHQIILDVISERKKNLNNPSDLLTTLLTAQDEKTHQPFAIEKILDETKTFLLTGHETTGTALTWTIYLLATHPQEKIILQKELANHLHGNPAASDDLEKLSYLHMVCEESLRLYPPIWVFTRCSISEDEIDGYRIPAKQTISISPFVMHHLSDYWEQPFVFNPLHFSEKNKNKRPKYTYIPFGVGARTCIGGPLALFQLQLILAILLQKFDFIPSTRKPVKLDPLISLKPHGGIWVRVKEI